MALRDLFNDAEWRTLEFAPVWAFNAVAAADGKVDEKEVAALGKELLDAGLYKGELARAVLRSVGDNLEQVLIAYKADARGVLDGLSQVADILDRTVSADEARKFKGAMLVISKNVGEASRGGLLRPKISKEEKVSIVAIAVALRAQL